MVCLRSALLGTALALVALFVVLISAAAVADEISRGAMLSASCYACHGTGGHSQGSIPSIYGIPKDSLIDKMQAFKNDRTLATVMNRHAKGYTDEEIRLIAEHLSQIQ
jgi:sulfide dehydrogenase cytochrome subunit